MKMQLRVIPMSLTSLLKKRINTPHRIIWMISLCISIIAACTSQSGQESAGVSRNNDHQAEMAGSKVAGEVPEELLQSILNDLMTRESLQRADIELERAEFVIWPSGALGCPEPGVMYTQAQVRGYWVVLSTGEIQHDYRATEKGLFRLCIGSSKHQFPVG